MSLRWPRSVESLFGRTPERALADAAATVNRVLKMQGFPLSVQSLNLSWQVVFMDERVPVAQIPYSLISNCHPAWMTPPANLYVVSQRVAEGCGGNRGSASVNDAQLAQILIHEIGHAIEFQLLRGHGAGDRIRAEGFACWFEQYASDYSSVTTRGSVRKKYLTLAKESYRQEPNQFNFRGTAMDYARASTLFYAVVEKAGIRGLMDVYGKMAESELSFGEAVQARFGWNADRFLNEAKSFAQKAD